MNEFTHKLFQRIHYEQSNRIDFNNISTLMHQFARHIPFENIDVINKRALTINRTNLQQKIINQQRGGLCYELNPFFYYLLKELGFDVQMITATITVPKNGIKGTHIANLLSINQRKYIVDVGFGSHLALQPIPLSGEIIHATTGDFQITQKHTDRGDYQLVKYQNDLIQAGYAFFTNAVDENDVNQVRETITSHPNSPFNHSVLLSKLTEEGHITLTKDTFTEIKNGKKNKLKLDTHSFKQLSEERFGITNI
ncbi:MULTISPECIES: arylamine N-acetyltransferase family protein [Virgibacillus]|uniref:N-hydroxyarylamine O-acetyltransferase n=2 Tax=Virgibacillus TaxID=84406 RepID=A0A024QE60_9BACI|nr:MULTISPECIES: arylamine N-acetyltransferase [Virgibacillus]EQB34984.1 hypothetical protein M948_17905 [Virgibacillus sp. CM-4]MYL42902.1 arylamine N-acetyltransferase [Virgibacillus massiliensis]GGJ70504.1 arylamine N-acetyltransferase [Virgibacillus kapii]CDQ40799.1 N-hydroxyarylamine O-acetyltransferase [Virgibacillus massiliensis]